MCKKKEIKIKSICRKNSCCIAMFCILDGLVECVWFCPSSVLVEYTLLAVIWILCNSLRPSAVLILNSLTNNLISLIKSFFSVQDDLVFVDEVRLWLWPVCRIQSMRKYHLGSLVGDGKSRNSYLLCLWNKIIITLINLCTCIIRFQFWRGEPAKPTPM